MGVWYPRAPPRNERGTRVCRVSEELDQRARTEATAAAHRHEPDLLVRALELVEQGRDQPRAGRAERVPQRDRAAVDVDAVHVRIELAAPSGDDRRERLVDLDEVD